MSDQQAPAPGNLTPGMLVNPTSPWQSQVRVVPQKNGAVLVILHVETVNGSFMLPMVPENAEKFFRTGLSQALRAQNKPVPGDLAVPSTGDVRRILNLDEGM